MAEVHVLKGESGLLWAQNWGMAGHKNNTCLTVGPGTGTTTSSTATGAAPCTAAATAQKCPSIPLTKTMRILKNQHFQL